MKLVRTTESTSDRVYLISIESDKVEETLKKLPTSITVKDIQRKGNKVTFKVKGSDISLIRDLEKSLSSTPGTVMSISEVEADESDSSDKKYVSTSTARKTLEIIQKILGILESSKLTPPELDEVMAQTKQLLSPRKDFSSGRSWREANEVYTSLCNFSDTEKSVILDSVHSAMSMTSDYLGKIKSLLESKGVVVDKGDNLEGLVLGLPQEDKESLLLEIPELKDILQPDFSGGHQPILKVFSDRAVTAIQALHDAGKLLGYWIAKFHFMTQAPERPEALKEILEKDFPYDYVITNFWGKKISGSFSSMR